MIFDQASSKDELMEFVYRSPMGLVHTDTAGKVITLNP